MALYTPRGNKQTRCKRVNYSITKELCDAIHEMADKKQTSVNDLVNLYLARGVENDQRQERRQKTKSRTSCVTQEEEENKESDDTK